jgi:hypothetical protein
VRDAYRFGCVGLAGWAGFSAWAELVPRGILPIFFKAFFFFSFEKDLICFAIKTCRIQNTSN